MQGFGSICMAKALPIIGIVGAVFGALLVAVLADAAAFIVVLVTLVGSVMLLAQRTIVGAVAGLIVLALTVVAGLGLVGSISTEDGGADFGISPPTGIVIGLAACLAVPMGAVAARWDELEPRWTAFVGIACSVLAVGIAAAGADTLSDHGAAMTLTAAAFALGAIVPMVVLLRSPGDDGAEPAPLAAVEAPVTKSSAAPARSKRAPGRRP
jgi:hypothetical protein